MPRNNSVIGFIIGLVIFLGFGVFFLFGWGSFSIFSFMPFFPMIFVIIIIGIAGAASANSRRSGCCPPKQRHQNQNYSQNIPRPNPYSINTSMSSTIREIKIEDDEPDKVTANFCQYCGTKKDRNAIYCHNCGSKLQ